MAKGRFLRWIATLMVMLAMGGCALPDEVVDDLRARWLRITPAPRIDQEASAESLRVVDTPSPTPLPPIVIQIDQEGTILEDLYERVNPSVVNIAVRSMSRVQGSPLEPRDPEAPDGRSRYGEGSGFVYDTQGHIVTNNHVVEGAQEVIVTFADGVSVRATVVGTDPDTDLAVIQVDAAFRKLEPLLLGDSDALRVGQRVVAIGNPFGLPGTMTTGIVSGLARLLPAVGRDGEIYNIPDVIQTDTAINPGNSGGPLLDLRGRVVGVNAAIESPVGGFAGVGFAIPSSIVEKVVPSLIEKGYYEHSWLGVRLYTLTPSWSQAAGLDEMQPGVAVVEVIPSSPAAEAGLRAGMEVREVEGYDVPVGGDIIVGIDDWPVRTYDDLITYLVRRTEVGQTITLTLLRDGQSERVQVQLSVRPKPWGKVIQGLNGGRLYCEIGALYIRIVVLGFSGRTTGWHWQTREGDAENGF